MYGLGYLMNVVVMAFNSGKMPVLCPEGYDPSSLDLVHSCMTAATRLRGLADWIFFGFNLGDGPGSYLTMGSPGDLLLKAGAFLYYPALVAWIVLMVRDRRDLSF